MVQKLFSDMAVHYLVDVYIITEQERDVQDPDGGIESADRSRRADIDIDGSLLHGFEQLPFALAELTVRVNGHLDAPVASLLDELCKSGCPLVVGVTRRSQGGKLQLGLEFPLFSLVRASNATAQAQKDKTSEAKDADLLHHDSPPW